MAIRVGINGFGRMGKLGLSSPYCVSFPGDNNESRAIDSGNGDFLLIR